MLQFGSLRHTGIVILILLFTYGFNTVALAQSGTCIIPGRGGDRILPIFTLASISLHHGAGGNHGIPSRAEVSQTASFLATFFVNDVADLVLVIPAAPYPQDLTRPHATSVELFDLLKD